MDYELVRNVNAAAITRFHDAALCPATAHAERDRSFEAVWQKIDENHRCNALLWMEEDKARRMDVADAYIAACKRRIDRYNQQRNDAVEAIDERLLQALGRLPRHSGARLHSETAGAMIDRLSILSLKIHHMRMHAEAAGEDAARCRAKRRCVPTRTSSPFGYASTRPRRPSTSATEGSSSTCSASSSRSRAASVDRERGGP